MKQNLLFSQASAICKRLAMVLTVLFTLGVGNMLGETIFNITSYSSIPSGWTNSGVSTGSYFKFDSNGCYLITSTYGPHTDLTLTYKVATYSSGTNHPLTIQLLDENGTVKATHTTGTPTSSSYISGTWSIGDVNYKFKIKFYLQTAGKGVRLQVPKLVGTPPPSCSNQVTITKASATGGSFKVHQGTASGTEISSGGKIDNCDANAVVVVVPTADANYTCTGVTATNSNSISGPDVNGNYTVTYTKDSNISSTITVTFTENQKHSVTWKVNNTDYNVGDPTKQVYDGGKVTKLPTAPDPANNCGAVFAGWTTTPIEGTTNTKPSVLFTTAENSPAITDNITFHAVFADYEQ